MHKRYNCTYRYDVANTADGCVNFHNIPINRMNNQVKLLDLNAEFRRQSRRYLQRIGELALGGLSAGLLLLAYSHTTFPAAHVTEVLLEKLGKEIALPDGRFLLAAIASCCVALIFTGWPPTTPFRKWVARPFLGFCFDLAGTAIGAISPAIIAAARPSEWGKAFLLILLSLFFLTLMSMMLWFGKYLLSERFQLKLKNYSGFYQASIPVGAGIILLLIY